MDNLPVELRELITNFLNEHEKHLIYLSHTFYNKLHFPSSYELKLEDIPENIEELHISSYSYDDLPKYDFSVLPNLSVVYHDGRKIYLK